MESNDELKDIDIKNCTCYCFNDMMRVIYFDFDNISSHFIQNFYWCKNHCGLDLVK